MLEQVRARLIWEHLSIARLSVLGCHRTRGAQQRMWHMTGPVTAWLTCCAVEFYTAGEASVLTGMARYVLQPSLAGVAEA